MTLSWLIALLIYPGLVFALLAGIGYASITRGIPQAMLSFRGILSPKAWGSNEGMLHGISIILAGFGLAFLPFPWHPAEATYQPAFWLLAWGGLEGAFLIALLPGLIAGSPHIVRATIREAQTGAAGRALLWLALTTSLTIHTDWSLLQSNHHSPLVVHGLALLAGIIAFPIATGWGAFAPETSITPGGSEQGLGQEIVSLMRAARATRTGALLTALLVALLPIGTLSPIVGLIILIALFAAAGILLKRQEGNKPRLSLPSILRVCWWRAFPSTMAALIYLTITLS